MPRSRMSRKTDTPSTSRLDACIKAAVQKKALEITVLDVGGHTAYADYFIICSGSSNRQVQAIAESIETDLKKRGVLPLGIEGFSQATWILLDYGDIVIHVFYQPVREFYQLERLWSDAPRLDVGPYLPGG